jgi:hypothetical protein
VAGILQQQRHIALAVITVLVIAASAASFAESYRGLYLWAHPEHAKAHFAAMLAAGTLPSLRTVRSELHVGTDRARELRTHLASLNGHATEK